MFCTRWWYALQLFAYMTEMGTEAMLHDEIREMSLKSAISLPSAPQSKNAVSTNIKHSRYIHLMSNFSSILFHTKRLYVHMFDIVDPPFIYGRGLIVCSSLQKFTKTKESALHVIWNVDTAFLLCGANLAFCLITLIVLTSW